MHKKSLLTTVGILISVSLLAALLLVLNSACVNADPSLAPHTELRGERTKRRANGREVTIVQPTTGDILTRTHQPTYTVEIQVGVVDMLVLDAISVSVDAGATYHQATGSFPDYVYDWGLPDEDYEEHMLIARARYSEGEPRIVSKTATVYVDTLPPQGVVITVPFHVESTGFTVSWSASDGSGVIAYDVEYRRDDQATWSSWVRDSSESSKVFMEPLEQEHSYTFRMRARDKGENTSNWVDGRVQVGPSYIYLPMTARRWVSWYQYDRYEPNDTPDQAWGPLQPGKVYEAYIWNAEDQDDYYHFTSPVTASVGITLTNIPDGRDYDLFVYYYSHMEQQYIQEAGSNNPGSAGESVTFTAVPLRQYYVRVYPYVGFSSAQAYHLELTYGFNVERER